MTSAFVSAAAAESGDFSTLSSVCSSAASFSKTTKQTELK